MTLYEYFLVFPDGQMQEVFYPISVFSFVDMNGRTLSVPLPTNKMIVYQVSQKRTVESDPGIIKVYYVLEQLNANELLDYL